MQGSVGDSQKAHSQAPKTKRPLVKISEDPQVNKKPVNGVKAPKPLDNPAKVNVPMTNPGTVGPTQKKRKAENDLEGCTAKLAKVAEEKVEPAPAGPSKGILNLFQSFRAKGSKIGPITVSTAALCEFKTLTKSRRQPPR